MSSFGRFRRRIRAQFSRHTLDRDLADEMNLHVAMETEDLIRSGVSADEAARLARVAFGGVERHKEETRDARGVRWIESSVRDVGYILRSLRRAPAFTFAVIFSLALGIGANSTMFTIINAVLLRPLPYPGADELLAVSGVAKGVVQPQVMEPLAREWMRSSRTLASVAIFKTAGTTVTGSAPPESVGGVATTSELFTVLESRPALGRLLTSSDEQNTAEPVVVLSDALWRRHFAADSAIIGRIITLGDKSATVVGVMTAGLEFPSHAEYWVPWKPPAPGGFQSVTFFVRVVARAARGAPIERVQQELSQLVRRTDASLRPQQRGSDVIVTTLHDQLYGSARPALRILFAAVLLLLLIACANVANLVFARTTRRQQEFAVRVTLGATRRAMVSLIVSETVALAIAAAVVGLVVSVWATRVFVGISPPNIASIASIGVNGRVFAFTAALALACAFLVGLGPAIRASGRDPRAGLADGGARAGAGKLAVRVRRSLVVAQLAIAVILLAGAGLLVRSLGRLTSVELGFRPANVLTVDLNLPYSRYATSTSARTFFDQLAAQLRATPGVAGVTYGLMPLAGFMSREPVAATAESPATEIAVSYAGERFFETLDVPIVAGRGVLATDDSAAEHVAVLNATAARFFFPRGGALGKRLPLLSSGNRPPTVVGIVADFPQVDVATRAAPQVFVSPWQDGGRPFTIAVRTSDSPAALMPAVRARVHDLDPALAIGNVSTLEKAVASSMAPVRFASLLLTAFAMLAVTLAAIGLYGVITYGVAQRTREFGIRAALGATGPILIRLVAGEMMWVIALGISIGMVGAWLLARLLQNQLYGTSVHDPLTFVLVPVALLIPAVIATLLPARKAMRVNPLDVIQAE
jgi:putative ABC transport system permease protein